MGLQYSGLAIAADIAALAAHADEEHRFGTPLQDAAAYVFGVLKLHAPQVDKTLTFADVMSLDLDAHAALGATPLGALVSTVRVPPFEGEAALQELSMIAEVVAFYADDFSSSYLLSAYRDGQRVRRWRFVPPQPLVDEGAPLASEPMPADASPGDHLERTLKRFLGVACLAAVPMETY